MYLVYTVLSQLTSLSHLDIHPVKGTPTITSWLFVIGLPVWTTWRRYASLLRRLGTFYWRLASSRLNSLRLDQCPLDRAYRRERESETATIVHGTKIRILNKSPNVNCCVLTWLMWRILGAVQRRQELFVCPNEQCAKCRGDLKRS